MNGPMVKAIPYLVGPETVIVIEITAINNDGELFRIDKEIARFPREYRACISAVGQVMEICERRRLRKLIREQEERKKKK